MKVVVRDSAARDLEDIFNWISKDNPRPPSSWWSVSGCALIGLQRGLSHIGRPGLIDGTRELVEPPYIVVYEVDEAADEVTVLAVKHGARDREGIRVGRINEA